MLSDEQRIRIRTRCLDFFDEEDETVYNAPSLQVLRPVLMHLTRLLSVTRSSFQKYHDKISPLAGEWPYCILGVFKNSIICDGKGVSCEGPCHCY